MKISDTTKLLLPAMTNSGHAVPDSIEVDKVDLDALIHKCATQFDWAAAPEVHSFALLDLPPCEFVSEIGESTDDDEFRYWQSTMIEVGRNFAVIKFAHKYSGDELFFEYYQEDENDDRSTS